MSFDIKMLVKSEQIYEFLENSFLSTLTLLQQEDKISDKIQYEMFKSQADFDGTLNVPMYADDDDDQKINYGILRFLGGAIEPSGGLDLYLMSYSLETLDFEEYRDDIRLLLTTLAYSLNGNIVTINDSEGATIPMLVETATFPTMSETIDANGADKFMTSNIINITLFPQIAHADEVILMINGIQVPFVEVSFNRSQVEAVPNLNKSYEVRVVPNRTSFSVSINGYYKYDNASQSVFDWLMDETKLAQSFRLFYSDGFNIKTGVYLIDSSSLDISDGQPITYNMTLLPYNNVVQDYFGLLVIGADGTNEYEIGDEIELSYDDDDFDS
jgi:hypothetical protein